MCRPHYSVRLWVMKLGVTHLFPYHLTHCSQTKLLDFLQLPLIGGYRIYEPQLLATYAGSFEL
jgi:hypothetical protein